MHRQYAYGAWLSQSVLEAAAAGFLQESRGFRLAAGLADAGAEHVLCAPTSFPTEKIMDLSQPGALLSNCQDAANATQSDRQRLWAALSKAARQRGVELVQQPDHTVVDGVLTDVRYAVDYAQQKQEVGHKSPDFAALMMSEFKAKFAGVPGSALKTSFG